MTRSFSFFTLLVSLLCIPSQMAWAIADPLVVTPPPMNFDGAADGTPAGTPITSTWIGETSVHNGFKCEKKFLQNVGLKPSMLMLLVQKLAGSTITKVVIVILFIHSPELKVSAMLLV